jgi:16S rRNA U1498 N3-methylase RsmE
MRLNRIYTPASLEPEQETRLAEKQAHYLHRVLRLGSGDTVTAGIMQQPSVRSVKTGYQLTLRPDCRQCPSLS